MVVAAPLMTPSVIETTTINIMNNNDKTMMECPSSTIDRRDVVTVDEGRSVRRCDSHSTKTGMRKTTKKGHDEVGVSCRTDATSPTASLSDDEFEVLSLQEGNKIPEETAEDEEEEHGAGETDQATAETTKRTAKLSVRFVSELPKFHYVERIEDMTLMEKSNKWFSREDLQAMELRDSLVLTRLTNQRRSQQQSMMGRQQQRRQHRLANFKVMSMGSLMSSDSAHGAELAEQQQQQLRQFRGLELRAKHTSRRRKQTIARSVVAVLQEQGRQRRRRHMKTVQSKWESSASPSNGYQSSDDDDGLMDMRPCSTQSGMSFGSCSFDEDLLEEPEQQDGTKAATATAATTETSRLEFDRRKLANIYQGYTVTSVLRALQQAKIDVRDSIEALQTRWEVPTVIVDGDDDVVGGGGSSVPAVDLSDDDISNDHKDKQQQQQEKPSFSIFDYPCDDNIIEFRPRTEYDLEDDISELSWGEGEEMMRDTADDPFGSNRTSDWMYLSARHQISGHDRGPGHGPVRTLSSRYDTSLYGGKWDRSNHTSTLDRYRVFSDDKKTTMEEAAAGSAVKKNDDGTNEKSKKEKSTKSIPAPGKLWLLRQVMKLMWKRRVLGRR